MEEDLGGNRIQAEQLWSETAVPVSEKLPMSPKEMPDRRSVSRAESWPQQLEKCVREQWGREAPSSGIDRYTVDASRQTA